MSPFAFLGLEAHASERDIKRAYARLLRQSRPEDDAAGFQQLNQAYQDALEYCRSQSVDHDAVAALPDTTAPGQTHSATHDVDAQPGGQDPEPPPDDLPDIIEIDPLCERVIDATTRLDPQALTAWLDEQPELWSLAFKDATGDRLPRLLHEQAPSIENRCCQVLFDYFDLFNVNSAFDTLSLQTLQQRLHVLWSIEHGSRDDLGKALGITVKPWRMHRVLGQLRKPLHFWQWIPGLCAPLDLISRLMEMVSADSPVAQFNGKQIAFWKAAENHGQLRPQHLLLFGTHMAFVLVVALVTTLLGMLTIDFPFGPSFAAACVRFLVGCVSAVGLAYVLWFAFKGLGVIDQWHRHDEGLPVLCPWLCFVFTPLMCAVALACMAESLPIAAVLLGLCTMWLAFRRLARGCTTTVVRIIYIGLWFGVFTGLKVMSDHPSDGIWMLVGMAMLMWLVDAIKHRHRLRVWHLQET